MNLTYTPQKPLDQFVKALKAMEGVPINGVLYCIDIRQEKDMVSMAITDNWRQGMMRLECQHPLVSFAGSLHFRGGLRRSMVILILVMSSLFCGSSFSALDSSICFFMVCIMLFLGCISGFYTGHRTLKNVVHLLEAADQRR